MLREVAPKNDRAGRTRIGPGPRFVKLVSRVTNRLRYQNAFAIKTRSFQCPASNVDGVRRRHPNSFARFANAQCCARTFHEEIVTIFCAHVFAAELRDARRFICVVSPAFMIRAVIAIGCRARFAPNVARRNARTTIPLNRERLRRDSNEN